MCIQYSFRKRPDLLQVRYSRTTEQNRSKIYCALTYYRISLRSLVCKRGISQQTKPEKYPLIGYISLHVGTLTSSNSACAMFHFCVMFQFRNFSGTVWYSYQNSKIDRGSGRILNFAKYHYLFGYINKYIYIYIYIYLYVWGWGNHL